MCILLVFTNTTISEASGDIVNQSAKYDYSEMEEDIKKLKERYPFLKVETIGKTLEGRKIHKITLGKGYRKVNINGSHHGREWITSLLTMEMLERYADAYANNKNIESRNVRYLTDRVGMVFIPMVNPDGVQIAIHGPTSSQRSYFKQIHGKELNWNVWKANGQGTDPNSNYNYEWAPNPKYPKPGAFGYRGVKAESAIETATMAADARQYQYRFTLSYHSSGEILFWYANQTGNRYDRDYKYVKEASKITGYSIVPKGSSLNTPAGFTDYIAGILKQPAITVEVAPSKYAGTQVSMTAYSAIWKQNESMGLWAADKVNGTLATPTTPTVNTITNNSTAITGKAQNDVIIYATVGTKVIGKATSNGVYHMTITKQKAGTKISVYAENKDRIRSKTITTIVVDKTAPPSPIITEMNYETSIVTGKAEAKSTVTIFVDNLNKVETITNDAGVFQAQIQYTKDSKLLTLYATDEAGNRSKTTMYPLNPPQE